MRKLAVFLLVSIFAIGCKSGSSTTSSSTTSTKTDKKSQVAIKGDFKITSVTYPGSDYLQVKSFQIADSKCFVGSEWHFISNNNKGSMSLTKSGCPAFSSPIVWSINKEGVMGLKFVEDGTKSKTVTQGYLLSVINQTENSFQLVDVMKVGGQFKEITYHFERM